MANTFVNKEIWKEALQEKLEEATAWKDAAEVTYTSDKTVHFPYRSLPDTSSYTRGAQYTPSDITVTDDTMVIDDSEIVAEFIDKADLAQNGYVNEVEMGQAQAIAINEDIEKTMLALRTQAGHSLNAGSLAGGTGTGNITVTGGATGNIAELFRLARLQIAKSRGGLAYMKRFGMTAFVDPENYEKAVSFAQKNGFMFADDALTEGQVPRLSGFTVRESNLLDSSGAGNAHAVFAVNKMLHLGILNTTYGDIDVVENPERRSGVDVVSRIDRKGKIWNNMQNFVVEAKVAV
jgi:hypothetical protein